MTGLPTSTNEGMRPRGNGGSAIYCAPQGIPPIKSGAKSPFPRRTRLLSNDNGELAASEEQGGSSDRSGSIRLNNYRGEGIINISSEMLNQNAEPNENDHNTVESNLRQ